MATDKADGRLAAPGELELVRDFVNTRDLEKGTDRIEEPHRLSSWLVERGFASVPPKATDDDVTRARNLREALRAMLLAKAGFPLEVGTIDAFNAAAERTRLAVRAEGTDRFSLLPVGEGPDRALGRLVSIVLAAHENGTWSRLKACAECRWALYDRTKNRSAAWCDPNKCGARVRSRRYRGRRARPAG